MTAIPKFLTAEALVRGIFPETRIATPKGWRAAAFLRPGQSVMTVGAGALRLIAIETQPTPLWVQVLPAGACGNRGPVRLPPGQPVLVETDVALPMTGEPFALIPAEALEGWREVASAPNVAAPVLLWLEAADLIYAGPGLILGMPGPEGRMPTPLLPLAEARPLVARLLAEDVGSVLGQAALGGANRA
jgi:hypothetical protein